MGIIGGPGRSVVSTQERRRAYMKKAREDGFSDGLFHGHSLGRFSADEEARCIYLSGVRLGKRERERGTS